MANILAGPAKALRTFTCFCEDVWHLTFWVRWVLVLPLRMVAWLANFCVATTKCMIRSAILACFGLFGLAFIAMLTFGLVRTIFHPFFD